MSDHAIAPGEWTVMYHEHARVWYLDTPTGQYAIKRTSSVGTHKEDASVMRRIAAAPRLLAACEAALWEDCGLACANELRAAIAEALGGQP